MLAGHIYSTMDKGAASYKTSGGIGQRVRRNNSHESWVGRCVGKSVAPFFFADESFFTSERLNFVVVCRTKVIHYRNGLSCQSLSVLSALHLAPGWRSELKREW